MIKESAEGEGPLRNIPRFNFTLFHLIASFLLICKEYTVFRPLSLILFCLLSEVPVTNLVAQ